MADAKDDPRARILARRAKYVALAIAGVGMTACGATSQTCLDIAILPDGGDDGGDGDADAAPQPCLEPPLDAGADVDAAPQPCLDVAPDASGDADDGTPQPCLTPVMDGSVG